MHWLGRSCTMWAALALLCAWGCRRGPAPANEVVAIPVARPSLDPEDAVWRDAPEFVARLLPQDVVEPRLMKPSTPEVRVRALAAAAEIAFRLEWTDARRDDLTGPGRFADACAVQLPAQPAPEPPNPQMGEAGRTVEITYWRADWQAWTEGRRDDIRQIYPNAAVDHYPFGAPTLEPGSAAQRQMARLYMPADALGNRRSGPRDSPVEDLLAQGPGTLEPARRTLSRGRGVFGKGRWKVVLVRPLPAGLTPRARTQVAFAVWQGAEGEAGARKMRTGWAPLLLKERP